MSDKITLQKIFDLAWDHFIVGDGKPAVDRIRGCCYRTDQGHKCAVGLALPDGHESQNCVGSMPWLVNDYPELFDSSVVNSKAAYLEHFQARLHDDLIVLGDWQYDKAIRREKYLEVAKDYGLTVPGEGNDTV